MSDEQEIKPIGNLGPKETRYSRDMEVWRDAADLSRVVILREIVTATQRVTRVVGIKGVLIPIIVQGQPRQVQDQWEFDIDLPLRAGFPATAFDLFDAAEALTEEAAKAHFALKYPPAPTKPKIVAVGGNGKQVIDSLKRRM